MGIAESSRVFEQILDRIRYAWRIRDYRMLTILAAAALGSLLGANEILAALGRGGFDSVALRIGLLAGTVICAVAAILLPKKVSIELCTRNVR